MSYSPYRSSAVKTHSQYCPRFKSCPYLGGEPARKVFSERNYFRARIHEMEEVFNLAQNEISILRQRISSLEQENNHLKEDLTAARLAPFKKASDKKNGSNQEPRKRGAPFGHPGACRRKPENIDRFVAVTVDNCPDCNCSELSLCQHLDQHIQQDIVIKVINTCFVHLHYWCPVCKKVVSGYAPDEIPRAHVGPNAKALAGFLRHEIKISYDDIQRIFQNLFGLPITGGAIVGFDNKIYKQGLPLYQGLKSMLPFTSNIHADETGWKIDGKGAWLWTFTNEQLAFYHIDRHRSGDVVKDHLGAEYNGILSSDFYSAYNRAIKALAKQKCVAHLLRDIKDLEEKFPDEDTVSSFCQNLKRLIQDALLLHTQYQSEKLTLQEWKFHKKDLFTRLKQISQIPLAQKEAETLRKRLVKHQDEILTFLKHPEIEPTNNRAEQALRNPVLLRKIIFGNRSDQGARNISLITTIIRTAKLKKLNPPKVLQTLLTRGLTLKLAEQFGLPKIRPP